MRIETGIELLDQLRQKIRDTALGDEAERLKHCVEKTRISTDLESRVQDKAYGISTEARRKMAVGTAWSELISEFDLSTREGILLMGLAEALLRIPDRETAERLIDDKLSRGQWDRLIGDQHTWIANSAIWGLSLYGSRFGAHREELAFAELGDWISRSGKTVTTLALRAAMRFLADHYVLGRDIHEALERIKRSPGLRYSFDCLGEAVVRMPDAEDSLQRYRDTLLTLAGRAGKDETSIRSNPGISIKLSALHPRYEYAQTDRVLRELIPRLHSLCLLARKQEIDVTIDAEEYERLDLMLNIFQTLKTNPDLATWDGLGIAVQAYLKCAGRIIDWLYALARHTSSRIPVRLVKGAYWDTEIKHAQELGLTDYPVFTQKYHTDLSYLACARQLMDYADQLEARFATHNAYTLAWLDTVFNESDFEYQRLHGMGAEIYTALSSDSKRRSCRIYAPIGTRQTLLPYLIRRLLENGASTSFLNQLANPEVPIETLVRDPFQQISATESDQIRIRRPPELFTDRRNSTGMDLANPDVRQDIETRLAVRREPDDNADLLIPGAIANGNLKPVINPTTGQTIGQVMEMNVPAIQLALRNALAAFETWSTTHVEQRAELIEKVADQIEEQRLDFACLIIEEGGRCIRDALSEVRETIDYCRYYAQQARKLLSDPVFLPGPDGEQNQLCMAARGPFICISPWNFPLAIFAGQLIAALVTGNPVIAKPASQTPLTARKLIRILHHTGIPKEVAQLTTCRGESLEEQLLNQPEIAGVAFTGSTDTARRINQTLARKDGPIVPFIAETGGLNVLIADSSALPEQLVRDVLTSAFNSAGQRCSALRVLFIQQEIADETIEFLADAMEELVIGDPGHFETDIGPVIDQNAIDMLEIHREKMRKEGLVIKQLDLPTQLDGTFFPPCLIELERLSQLRKEIFGPVLHVIRYRSDELLDVVEQINATGYGLTLGLHSRIESSWDTVRKHARTGNLYINRNMIGAVVESQPFGGEGLSGTGPKAGGPHYLTRFLTERTVTVNTAAIGGSVSLLSEKKYDSTG